MFIWKEMIGEITRVDKKGIRYNTENVLRRAKARCLTRMRAFEQGVEIYTHRKISKGENPQKGYENYQKQVKGIMSLDEEDGSISIDENMQRWLDSIEDSKNQDVRIVAALLSRITRVKKLEQTNTRRCFSRRAGHHSTRISYHNSRDQAHVCNTEAW